MKHSFNNIKTLKNLSNGCNVGEQSIKESVTFCHLRSSAQCEMKNLMSNAIIQVGEITNKVITEGFNGHSQTTS